MKLLDPATGKMECTICGAIHYANIQSGRDRKDGIPRYYRGSWQCQHGCKVTNEEKNK